MHPRAPLHRPEQAAEEGRGRRPQSGREGQGGGARPAV